jgi:hypothetical protein
MLMPVALTAAGKRPCTLATRFCTSTAAMSRFVAGLEGDGDGAGAAVGAGRADVAHALDAVDGSSSGMVTAFSTVSALAPT